jgi:hypothetical protein
MRPTRTTLLLPALLLALAVGCAKTRPYQDRNMDFGAIKTVVVMPFWNLTSNQPAADRVRDVFSNALLATNAVYVVPTGEVARAATRLGLATAATPSTEEIVKLGAMLKADAVITGVVKEYGEVRTTAAASNVVSLSLQMHETGSGKVIWSGASTKGGVTWGARLLGTGGGEPMNAVTEQVVDDLLAQLFQQ